MRLTAEERASRREAFRRMNLGEKAEYIFAYYKLPLALGLIFAYMLCYTSFRVLTRKETLLGVGFLNVAVNEDLEAGLSGAFLRFAGQDPRKAEVSVYPNLYLSDDPAAADHEYAYASRLKFLAAVNAKQLDVVFMNREAYDILSGNGWLEELSPDFFQGQPNLYRTIEPLLTENKVILEDNELDYTLGKAESYQETAAYVWNGLDTSRLSLFQDADLTDTVYLGVMPNSTRLDSVRAYLAYLLS